MKDIAYYKKHGALPPEEVNEKYPVPKSPAEQIKKQLSLRASISRLKKKISDITNLPETAPDKKKLPAMSEKLKEYQIHLSHVESAIKQASI